MKIKLFFAVFFLVIITSCSKDSSPSEPKISQDLLDAITGLYNLSEYIVSPPQDLNNDDVLSQDLMEELDCLSASIILREDLSYSKFAMQLNISLITNDLYAISCNFNQSTTGTWDLVNGQIVLSEESENSYALDGSVLTLTLGGNATGFSVSGIRKTVSCILPGNMAKPVRPFLY